VRLGGIELSTASDQSLDGLANTLRGVSRDFSTPAKSEFL